MVKISETLRNILIALLGAIGIFAVFMYYYDGSKEDYGEARILKLSAPSDGLLAPPLLYMVKNDALKEKNIELEFIPWRSQEQLVAYILNGTVDIVGLPLTGAANFHKRGVPLRFLGASLENVIYIISTDKDINSFSDLENRRVVIPMKGRYPDIFFQAVYRSFKETSSGFSLQIQYAQSSRDAANMIAGGRADAALIAEPHASILLEKNPDRYYRSLNVQETWNSIQGKNLPVPVAGIAALHETAFDNELLETFWQAYEEAMEWCLLHPEQAAGLLNDLTTDRTALSGTEKAFQICARKPIPSGEEREVIELFLQILHGVAPEHFSVPDSPDFYFRNAAEEENS